MIGKRKKDEKEQTEQTEQTIPADGQPRPDVRETDPDENAVPEMVSEEVAPEVLELQPDTKLLELNDKYMRLYSDFDNFRKRTLKEKIELSKNASAEIITLILPVLDDFERAIKVIDVSSEAGQAMKDGVVLIFNKLFSLLNQKGLEQMRCINEKFDTDFHEAVTNIPAPTPEQKGKIIDEIQKGYLLNGKVIRYAKVVVGS